MTHAEGGHVRAAHQASQRSSAEKRVAGVSPSLNALATLVSTRFPRLSSVPSLNIKRRTGGWFNTKETHKLTLMYLGWV